MILHLEEVNPSQFPLPFSSSENRFDKTPERILFLIVFLQSSLYSQKDFILLKADESNIIIDGLLLSQSLYSRLMEPIKSSDASDCSETFPLRE